MKRRSGLFTLLLSLIMVLGLFPNVAFAATGGQADFQFILSKTVVQAGSEAPGEQTFTFLLEDANGRTPADYGITITNSTITTNGTGIFGGSFTGSVDTNSVTVANGWSTNPTTQSEWTCTFTLKEKNDGVEGWSYASNTYTVTIYFYPGTSTAAAGISDGVNALNEAAFVNTYTKEPAPVATNSQFTVKKTDANGTPLSGATFSLTGTGNSVGQYFEAVSGNDGIATFDVPAGFYTLAEKTAPDGYIKSDKTYEIAIWDNTVHFYNENAANANEQYSTYQQVTFVNEAEKITTTETTEATNPSEPAKPAEPSPKTGDNSVMWLNIALFVLSGTGIAAILFYGKKRNMI